MKTILLLLSSSLACFGQVVGSAISTNRGSNTVVTIVASAPVVTSAPGYWTTNSQYSPGAIELPTLDVVNPANPLNVVVTSNALTFTYSTNWQNIPGTSLFGHIITTNAIPGPSVVMTVHWALSNSFAVWNPAVWTTNRMSQILGTTNKYPSGVVTTWTDTSTPPPFGSGTNTGLPYWSQLTIPASQPLPPVSLLSGK